MKIRIDPPYIDALAALDDTGGPGLGRGYRKGGGGGTTTTVQNIPDELKPLASAYTSKALELGNQYYSPYPYGDRYADLTASQNAGIGMIQDRALGGSDVINSGSNYLTSVLNGESGATKNPYGEISSGANPYAGSNDYLESAIGRSLGDVQTRVNSQFSGNNYGSTAHQETLGRTLGDVDSAMRMQDYTTQQGLAENALNRGLQAQTTNASLGSEWAGRNDALKQGALSQGLNYGNQDYTDASQLLNAGQIQQNQNQNDLDFTYQQWEDRQNLPYKQLAAMSGVFDSNLGASSTTKQSGGGK